MSLILILHINFLLFCEIILIDRGSSIYNIAYSIIWSRIRCGLSLIIATKSLQIFIICLRREGNNLWVLVVFFTFYLSVRNKDEALDPAGLRILLAKVLHHRVRRCVLELIRYNPVRIVVFPRLAFVIELIECQGVAKVAGHSDVSDELNKRKKKDLNQNK
jgi:hypothetical protein